MNTIVLPRHLVASAIISADKHRFFPDPRDGRNFRRGLRPGESLGDECRGVGSQWRNTTFAVGDNDRKCGVSRAAAAARRLHSHRDRAGICDKRSQLGTGHGEPDDLTERDSGSWSGRTSRTCFPEISGLEITPRAESEPSIELPIASIAHIKRAQETRVDFMVFLNRGAGSSPQLVRYNMDVTRRSLQRVRWGSAKSLTVQFAAIDRLLTAEVLELRYIYLDWAIDRLRTPAREGR